MVCVRHDGALIHPRWRVINLLLRASSTHITILSPQSTLLFGYFQAKAMAFVLREHLEVLRLLLLLLLLHLQSLTCCNEDWSIRNLPHLIDNVP